MRAIFANSLEVMLDAAKQTRKLHGLTIIIETPQYGVRQGKGWMSAAPADYGYIEGTNGNDGDEVDCYIGPSPLSKDVFVVDQNRIGSDAFDECKVVFGCTSVDEAKQLYLDGHTDGERIFRAITPVSIRMLKLWLRTGNPSKPYSEA